MITNRRTFIKQAGVLSGGIIFNKSNIFRHKKPFGLQLYTLGDLRKDVAGGIKKVAEVGYSLVETSGYTAESKFWGLDADAFKIVLQDNGLNSPSGLYFFDLKGNLDDLKHFIEVANTVGQKYLVQPWLLEEWRKDGAGYQWIAAKMNEAGELTRKAGIQLAYHNHDFELKDIGGQTGLDIMLKETDPKLVSFEMDIYWIARGGLDPLSLFKKYPGRFPLWHVKDMDRNDPKLNTEVGTGTIDFKTLFAHSKLSGLQFPFIEQENFKTDTYKSIAQSAAYLKSIY